MDTKLWARNTPNGLFTLSDRNSFPTGNIWWVGSTVATCSDEVGSVDNPQGRTPDAPFATWAYAVAASAAGDTIYLLPGHAETIGVTGAAAITLSKAGVRHIGLGGRTLKPAILVDAYTDTYVSVTGDGTVIENIAFSAGHSDIAVGMIVAADGVEIRKCDFLQNTTNENFLICLSDAGANTADGLIVEDCTFIGYDTSNTHGIAIGFAQDRMVIRNNLCIGFWETMAIGGAGVPTNVLVENNYIQNKDTDADQCIYFPDLTTGCIVRNLVGSAVAGNVTTNIYVGTKAMACENYSVDAVGDVQGVLDPVAT